MPVSTVTLIATNEIARDTLAVQLTKPDGFAYRAGQYADITLLKPRETDTEGDTREFTLSSAPCEDHLTVTVRLRNTAFKRSLQHMVPGAEVELDAPYGSFVLHRHAERPAVFVTGGVGVTPARSILTQAHHDQPGHRVWLFASNKTPATAVYIDELMRVDAADPNITVIPTMTGPDAAAQGWTGRTGRIDAALLAATVPDLTAPIYYLCGPAGMVAGLRGVLAEAGVDDDDIRVEEFLGY